MRGLSQEARARAGLTASMCLFGTIGVFVRYIPLSSGLIALVRGVIGTLFLLAVVWVRGARISFSDIRRSLLPLCVSGVFLGANWILLFEAYRYTSVAVATLCYYLAPVFVMLVSPFVLHERLTVSRGLCAMAALIGMALISGLPGAGSAGGFGPTGILLGLGAAALYACIMLLNKRLGAVSGYDRTIVQLGISAVTLLPYVLLTDGAPSVPAPRTLLLLLTVGVLHTGVAYALYFGSMRDLPAQTVAIFSYIDPVVAILLSALVLKERMGVMSIIGAVLVLGATLLSELLDHHKRNREAENYEKHAPL